MIDAVSEFLTENRQRRYPFAESVSLLEESGTYEIPDDLILDYRGFHRARPELKPRLAAITGSHAGGLPIYPSAPSKLRFFFEMGIENAPLRIMAEVDENNPFDVVELSASVADPFYADVNIATIRVTIGPGWRSLIGSAYQRVFPVGNALLEPALTVESYRSQIDYLRIIHQEGPTEYLRGDVKVYGGHNLTVSARGTGLIYFSAEAGAGELGRFTGHLRDGGLEYCDGSVMFLNGAGPDDRGEMTFKAGTGMKVLEFPDEHKIRIQVSPESLLRPLCEP